MSDWVLSSERLPAYGQDVETSEDGVNVDDELVYLESRTCMMAGHAGGYGYFGEGFATNGHNGCDYGLICETPKYWRPIE